MGTKAEWRSDLRGADYEPFLTMRVPSQGRLSRLSGQKTGRTHLLLSGLETDYFYLLEWQEDVVDIREQFALPQSDTVAIADALGKKHPQVAGKLHRMTSDFVVTRRDSFGDSDVVRSCKMSSDLEDTRTLEKLEIERRYWNGRGMEWKLVTERELPVVLLHNIRWVHPYMRPASVGLALDEINLLLLHLKVVIANQPSKPLRDLCLTEDDRLGLPLGTHLSLVRHGIAAKRWNVDMSVKIDPVQPIRIVDTKQIPGADHEIRLF
jgi:hypothetical protein